MDDVLITDAGYAVFGNHKIAIPDYRLTAILGRGANGIVFRARHKFLSREHAIKVWLKLKPRDNRDKFQQGVEEARKAASLQSSYVVPVHHAGAAGPYFYSVMDIVDGPTLHEILYGRLFCNLSQRHALAALFLDAVFKTSRDDLYHGDLHSGATAVTTNIAARR